MINLHAGSHIGGKYEVLECLGAGGMGAVYLARDHRHPEFKVALKVLYPGVLRSAEAKERFRYEINAAYRVNHPNVVQAYEFFDDKGMFSFAMEYVDGGDLFSRIEKKNINMSEAIEIIKQSAAGLDAIHAQGIIHRDLKPENILIAKDGTVKISDFGVARLSGGIDVTQSGMMVGTPKYVSPEYVDTGETDHKGDIYALGVILFECIAGRSPFRSTTKDSLLMERFEVTGEEIKEFAPHCSEELVGVICKAMNIDPKKRYQTAREYFEDLERLQKGEEVLAPKPVYKADKNKKSSLIQKLISKFKAS